MTADVLRSTRSALPGLIAKEGVTCVVEVKSVRDTCRQLADTPMSFRHWTTNRRLTESVPGTVSGHERRNWQL